jgi:hypothetical protein
VLVESENVNVEGVFQTRARNFEFSTMNDTHNPYLSMSIERVRQDALHGVSLAREAWRQRQPEQAARALGAVVEPEQQKARVIAAVGAFLAGRKHPKQRAGKPKTEQEQLW